MLILSDKLLLDIQLNHTFMPKMIHKPWMVSNSYVPVRCFQTFRILYLLELNPFSKNYNFVHLSLYDGVIFLIEYFKMKNKS